MRRWTLFSAGLLSAILLTTLLLGSNYQSSYADAPFLTTQTALPTGVSSPVSNQDLTLGEPLPVAEIAENAITVADVPNLEVQMELATGIVYDIEFSRDGRFMGAFQRDTEQYHVWDMETLEIIATFAVYDTSAFTRGIFSPDGKYVAFNNYPNPGWIEIWDIATQTAVQQYQGGTEVNLGFSDDGQQLCLARKGAHHTWDFASGNVLDSVKTPDLSILYPTTNTCDDVLRWATLDDHIITINTDDGTNEQIYVMPEAYRLFSIVKFSPHNTFLTVSPGFSDETLLIDTSEPTEVYALPGKVGHAWNIVWHPAETMVIFVQADNTLVFWDVAERKHILTMENYGSPVAFTPDGAYLIAQYRDPETREASLRFLAPLQ